MNKTTSFNNGIFTQIQKRDGRTAKFDASKIFDAIKAAFADSNETNDKNVFVALTNHVVEQLGRRGVKVPDVETIQDVVQFVLRHYGYVKTASQYIAYRTKRTKEREKKSDLFKKGDEICNADKQDSDLKRENANVDGSTAMGQMLHYGSAFAKEYYATNLMDSRFSKAHEEGDIHIHDMDFYGVTTTCCQIDLAKLFKDGFGTGHGSIREPQSIETAANLACIAIQSNQNDQHGGQSIPNFDRALAPYVDKTFYKEYLDALQTELEDATKAEPGSIDLRVVYVYTGDSTPIKYREQVDEQSLTNEEKIFLEEQNKAIVARFNLGSTNASTMQFRALQRASRNAQKATFQAMEALVHNLNTMHCVLGDCKIWVENNEEIYLTTIQELYDKFEPNKYKAFSINKETGELERKYITAIQKQNNHRDMIQITTKSGQVVTTTDNHKYICFNDKGFEDVEAKDVAQVSSPRKFQFGKDEQYLSPIDVRKRVDSPIQNDQILVNEQTARLLGIYTGDGSIVGNTELALTVCSKISEKDISQLVAEAFGQVVTYNKYYYNNNLIKEYRFNVGSRIARMFKKECGDNARRKKVPSCIMYGSSANKINYLNGLIQTDGRANSSYVEISTSSKDLADGLRFLIYGLGESCCISSSNEDNCIIYTVRVGAKAAKRIGLISVGETKFEIPKYNLSFVRKIATVQSRRSQSNNVYYTELEQCVPNNAASKKVLDIAQHLFIYDVVDKQTFNSNENYVYDISVEDNENFMTSDCAFIHNSRAGSQVPFSSINFGTDTSDSGRLVARQLMLAQEQGLGKGETPIFPILIFRLKDGINVREGDPNYDLFKLSQRVTSTRLFPNYSNQDATFNLQYYDKDKPETEIAYMGAVLGSSVITIKKDAFIETLTFKDAYEKYHDQDDVYIFDSSSNGFVKIKTWINNPDGGDWYKIKFHGGRELILTSDHPLPTQRGRIECKNLLTTDKVPLANYQFNNASIESKPIIDPWLLGMIVCDGCYKNNIVISVGIDETDIVDKIKQKYNNVSVNALHRGKKGNYIDVQLYASDSINRKLLSNIFQGTLKAERKLPSSFLTWSYEDRMNLLAGIVDADGYINTNKGCTVEIGSVNKSLAIEEMILAESVGCKTAIYENRYNGKDSSKVRFLVTFQAPEDFPIVCKKKRDKLNKQRSVCTREDFCQIYSIEFLGSLNERRYDVETESDKFDVDGINSHNCRTRVIGNVYDPTREITYSRGNLSFTSINLPRLAIKAKGNVDAFFKSLEELENLCFEQLLERFELQCLKRVLNFPFLMGQGVWLDSENLNDKDELKEVLKHGTLSVGFIGLAETLTSLLGKHHGESQESQELGLKIVKFMRDLADNKAKETGLNFSLLATPAEGLSGRFVKLDAKKYGVIQGVTDKKYYTNSFHVPVGYHISATRKIEIEAPYHELTNAGHISYIELDGDPSKNLEAVEELVLAMKEANMGYFALNHPIDIDPVCGYQGVIPGNVCPSCGRLETTDSPFDRIRRVTGYLTGTLDNFNDAKRSEESERVKHA